MNEEWTDESVSDQTSRLMYVKSVEFSSDRIRIKRLSGSSQERASISDCTAVSYLLFMRERISSADNREVREIRNKEKTLEKHNVSHECQRHLFVSSRVYITHQPCSLGSMGWSFSIITTSLVFWICETNVIMFIFVNSWVWTKFLKQVSCCYINTDGRSCIQLLVFYLLDEIRYCSLRFFDISTAVLIAREILNCRSLAKYLISSLYLFVFCLLWCHKEWFLLHL